MKTTKSSVKKSGVAARVRPLVQALHAYVPGEQPKIRGLIKLNTNENPYPPAPAVLKATRAAVDGRLRLYPNPTSSGLRAKLAQMHGCGPENIFIGNGSDEVLAYLIRAFAEPLSAVTPTTLGKATVQYLWPCYSLYPVLAETHGARAKAVPLLEDFALPAVPALKRGGEWDFDAALSLVTTPNAPSGRGYSLEELEALCKAQKGVIVLDEAYVDFAEGHSADLALKYPHVVVARTFSKAYSLCFQRVGYCIAHADVVAALDRVRDSYNVNGLGQVAAEATLDHLPYYRKGFAKVIRTRERLRRELSGLGWKVLPSQTNFLLAEPPGLPAKAWLERLREKKILVRWFSLPEIQQYLRITIGTDAEIDALLRAVRAVSRAG
jgi:histidinol-phosphate aminotransferase